MQPIVSIITVCLNSEKTIKKTIESVLGQSYDGEIEYIIIDGASVDNTLGIVEQYGRMISKVVSEPDTGIYEAMNKGIVLSKGEYIGIINSGDWYEREAVENAIQIFEDMPKTDIVYGRTMQFDGAREIGECSISALDTFWYGMPFPHPSVFVKKRCYEQCGLFDENYKIAGDYKWLFGCYLKGMVFSFCDKRLANFMLDGVSESHPVITAMEATKVTAEYAEEIEPPMGRSKVSGEIQERIKRAKIKEMQMQHREVIKQVIDDKIGNQESCLIMWGACDGTGDYVELLESLGYTIPFFIDNDKAKQGKPYLGRPVKSAEQGLTDEENAIIVFSTGHDDEIIKQIRDYYKTVDKVITKGYINACLIECYDDYQTI